MSKIRYLVAIEPGNELQAFGVIVPDLPGCFSTGDTLNKALDNAREAIDLWLEIIIEDGDAIPVPRSNTEHRANPEFSGCVWAVATIDLADSSGKSKPEHHFIQSLSVLND